MNSVNEIIRGAFRRDLNRMALEVGGQTRLGARGRVYLELTNPVQRSMISIYVNVGEDFHGLMEQITLRVTSEKFWGWHDG